MMRKVVFTLGVIAFVMVFYTLFAFWALDMGNQDQLHFAEDWLERIQSAEDKYHAAFGKYSSSLEDLGPRGAGFLDERYNHSEMARNQLVLTASKTGYTIQIYPLVWFRDGQSSLYTDETHVRITSFWPWRASK